MPPWLEQGLDNFNFNCNQSYYDIFFNKPIPIFKYNPFLTCIRMYFVNINIQMVYFISLNEIKIPNNKWKKIMKNCNPHFYTHENRVSIKPLFFDWID